MGNLARRYGLDQGQQDPKLKVAAIPVSEARVSRAEGGMSLGGMLSEVAALRAMWEALAARVEALEAQRRPVEVGRAALDEVEGRVGVATAVGESGGEAPWVALGLTRRTYYRRKKEGKL